MSRYLPRFLQADLLDRNTFRVRRDPTGTINKR